MHSYTLSIRGCTSLDHDARFIGRAFDSAIAHLPTIGSGGQWGTRTSAELPETNTNATIAAVEASLVHQKQPSGTLWDTERKELTHTRVLIAEATPTKTTEHDTAVDGARGKKKEEVREEDNRIPVAAVIYQDFVPLNLVNSSEFAPWAKQIQDRGNFIYLFALLSDFTAGEEARKGSGKMVVKETVEIARGHGYEVLYVDCWSGNGGRLVRYYENQGFVKVKEFVFTKPDGSTWPGTLLSMELK